MIVRAARRSSFVIARQAAPEAPTLLWLLGLHIGMAILMALSSTVATTHVAATVVACLTASLSRRPAPIVVLAAYVVGVENLWRMTGAVMPYHLPSYLLLALFLGMLLGRPRVSSFLPLVALGLLLPAASMTIFDIGMAEARERVSFVLLPHVVLAVSVVAFGSYRATHEFRRKVVAAMVVPIAAMASVVLLRTLSAGSIDFADASNFVTSGGFGPNRVSAALGLGFLLCILEATRERRLSLLVIEVALALWLAAQSLLTFSRGGMFSALIALTAGFVYRVVRRGRPGRALVVVGIAAMVLTYIVFPRLDSFTEGSLNQRFSNLETERTSLAKEDLALFRDNPAFGVGAGGAAFARPSGEVIPSHTEYTRLPAEHGLLGVAALVLLMVMAGVAVRRVSLSRRPEVVALFAWVFSGMAYANLRIAAASFVFAFAGLRATDDPVEATA